MSQYYEDLTLFETFYSNPPKCGGTIVEIGGFDGKTFSNSWFFEVRSCVVMICSGSFALINPNHIHIASTLWVGNRF